jgi:hypothetical protein
MAVTSTPIFCQTPNVGALNAIVNTAMTNTKAFDGTETVGTAMALVFTAGSDGSRVDQIACRFASTNGAAASGTSNNVVVRFWINNGSANTTATNNIFLGEVALAQATVTAGATSGLPVYYLSLPVNGLNLPASYRIYGGLAGSPGGTNLAIAMSAFGGNY